MKDLKDVVALVYDHCLAGVPMAHRLAEAMQKVYVFSEWEEGFSTVNKAIVGDGFKRVERCLDLWAVKDEVDLFVFPDIQHSGLQLELERQGKAVWGSRQGDKWELDRELFLKTLKDEGMDVPPYEVIVGLEKLREFLRNKEDYYIKVSTYRGSFETSHWRSWSLDKHWLDVIGARMGPVADFIRFLCFPNIETPLEIGGDTYCVDGQWPNLMLHGVEWKDRSYFAAVTPQAEMPQQIRQVLNTFGPLMKRERYRNQFSCECRVKKPKNYFIDFTARIGLPSTASQLRLWTNWAEIVWYGANGQLVHPKASARYSAEAIVTMKGSDEWRTCKVPEKLKPNLLLGECFEYDGNLCFPAAETPGSGDEVGWLVATGDTPEETIKNINKLADELPDGMDANTECLSYVLKEVQTEEKQGIKFGRLPIPSPKIVAAS